MDKQNQNPRIKIKINGEERPFKEKMEIHDWKVAKKETAAGAENASEEDSFDWVLPEIDENEVNEFKKIHYPNIQSKSSFKNKFKRKSGNQHLSALLISVITAVTIGVIIGIFMLKIVIYQTNSSGQANVSKNTDTNQAPSNNGISSTVQIPTLTSSFVQGGVFKDPEPIVNTIKSKGLPAIVLPMNNQNYIYISVSGNLDTAKELASLLKDKGVEVYAKELSIEGKKISITSKDEAKLITEAISLFPTLAEEISKSFITGQTNSEKIASLQEKINKMNSIKDVKSKDIDLLRKLEVTSLKSLISFKDQQNKEELMNAQMSLLTFVEKMNQLK
ncbi:hypothetical protein M3589_05400 [Heyndrickxia oleronia]|uniref:hypothetical protein n=1 Tax=Heyndrickxia oleronia TaxID=38875 RepID=UPI00203C0A85|nr:hypothetical protein [Heyndrickxia oleronia]MCM3237162.1 hypothetical protein [Heyndrickxia oleronia]